MQELFDPKRRALAKEYHSKKRRFGLITGLTQLAFWGWFLLSGMVTEMYHFVTNWTALGWLELPLYLGSLLLIGAVLDGFLGYFTSYRLERKYGLSTQTPKTWIADQIKGLLLMFLMGIFVAWGFLHLTGQDPANWWITFASVGFLFVLLLSFVMPVVLLPIFYKLTPYPENELRERLEGLFSRAGVKVAEIAEINLSSKTTSANAAVIGMGKTRKIILGDTLRERYTDGEVEAIMAHEIGHHAHRDIFKMLVTQLVELFLIAYLSAQIWPHLVNWLGYNQIDLLITLPFFFILWGILSWLFSPIQLYFSRVNERKADRYALRLIADSKDLATAFAKLVDDGLGELEYGPYKLLFKASHPPMGERVRVALDWNKNQ